MADTLQPSPIIETSPSDLLFCYDYPEYGLDTRILSSSDDIVQYADSQVSGEFDWGWDDRRRQQTVEIIRCMRDRYDQLVSKDDPVDFDDYDRYLYTTMLDRIGEEWSSAIARAR